MRPKEITCPIEELPHVIRELAQIYNTFNIYSLGHRLHTEKGLKDDYVLIRAHTYTPRKKKKEGIG